MVIEKAPEGFINIRPISEAGHKKVVYTGYQVLTQTWKVLKQFRESPTPAELADDLRPLALLQHENIVRQDSPQLVDGSVWLIEERLDGTFQELAPMEDQYAFSILASHISHGVGYLHGLPRPVIHGDIHLRNCGIVNGVAKLLDFGQATYYEDDHPRRAGVGYICTRAPEQFGDDALITTSIDVWSFGCTLYALRVGEYPFISPGELDESRQGNTSVIDRVRDRTWKGLNDAHARRHLDKFDSILWQLLDRMLRPKHEDRLVANEIAEAFDEYVATTQRSLRPATASPADLIRRGREMLENGKLARVPWFAEAISADEPDTTTSSTRG